MILCSPVELRCVARDGSFFFLTLCQDIRRTSRIKSDVVRVMGVTQCVGLGRVARLGAFFHLRQLPRLQSDFSNKSEASSDESEI